MGDIGKNCSTFYTIIWSHYRLVPFTLFRYSLSCIENLHVELKERTYCWVQLSANGTPNVQQIWPHHNLFCFRLSPTACCGPWTGKHFAVSSLETRSRRERCTKRSWRACPCLTLYFLYLPLSTINLKLRSFYQKNHLVLSSEDHTFSGVAFEASSCTNPYGLSTSLGIVLGGYSIGKTNKVLSVCRCSYCCLYLFIKMGNPQPLLSFIFVFSN